jgi:hypothetical protein
MNTLSIRGKQILYGSLILGIFALMVPYGSWLQRQKAEKDLGEATVGQVDAGSFMLKLAMIGGARGVVANALWMQAQELQRLQEWDLLKTKVDFITKLQPHFLSIWTFQGWNLAYNVSVEWDDPADKYVWIKNGINFLRDGVENNPRSPDLVWDTAWTYYHKLGFADESIILRQLFHDDEDEGFHTDPIDRNQYNDNFKVARGWFELAVDRADDYQRLATELEAPVEYVDPVENRKGRPGDLAFRTMPAHAQTRYAAALEKRSKINVDAQFGEKARQEWEKAEDEWLKFGEYEFRSPNALRIQGELVAQPIRIGDLLDPELITRLKADTAYWADLLSRYEGKDIQEVTPEEAENLTDNKMAWTTRWGDQNNFRYWVERCRAEMQPDGVRSRQLFYEGYLAYLDADFPRAVDLYKEGLETWDKLLVDFPTYRNDDLNRKDTGQAVLRYAEALRQAGREVDPATIPFGELLEEAELDPMLDPFDALDMLGPIGDEPAEAPEPAN